MKIPEGLNVLSEMPELDHWPGKEEGAKFDPEKSEVLRWMLSKPSVLNYVFHRIASMGLLVFDSQKKKWKPNAAAFESGFTPKVCRKGVWRDREEPVPPSGLRPGRPAKWKVEHLLDLVPAEGIGKQEWVEKAVKEVGMTKATFYGLRTKLWRTKVEVRNGKVFKV